VIAVRAGAYEIASHTLAMHFGRKQAAEESLLDRFIRDHRCERCLGRVRVMVRVDDDTVIVQCLGQCCAVGSVDVSGL
jgi:hypothetical protein